MNEISPMEVGWLAGIIEGEGNFDVSSRQAQIRVGMCDKDIVDRLFEVSGVGSVTVDTLRTEKLGHQPLYYWKVSRQRDCLDVIRLVMPLLGKRRRGKAIEMADFIVARVASQQIRDSFCKNGHPWTDESTGRCKTGRYCKSCKREYDKARPPRKRDTTNSSPSEVIAGGLRVNDKRI